MKQSNIIISIIVTAGVLIAALAVGLYIKDTRQKDIRVQPETTDKPEIKQDDIATKNTQRVEDEQIPRNPYTEQEAQLKEQVQIIKQRWVNMSEQERKEFRAKLIETFEARRPQTDSSVQTSPPEGRDMFAEEFLEVKSKWEDLTEQERQEFMEKMRESANAIRQGND